MNIVHILSTMLSRAKNGCGREISFYDRAVYYPREDGKVPVTGLGRRQETAEWVRGHLQDFPADSEPDVFTLVSDLLVDWQLFAGGWVVHGHQNHHLFHYLCDIGQWQTPPALVHLKPEA